MLCRLDRLFILLESGSSSVTRRAAAKQIGEVQRLHPHELHNLLNRLIVFIHSNSWETRIAASQAVQAILENVPEWNPKSVSIKKEAEGNGVDHDTRFSFEKFNLQLILEKGARLMGSEGKEFDFADDNESIDNRELLIKQRALLNEKLGFSAAKSLGINLDEMVSLEDMAHVKPKTEINLMNVQDIINNQASSSQSMSSREMNRAKRKARQNQASTSLSRSNSVKDEPEKKKIKTETNGKVFFANEPVPDVTGVWIDAVEWPLEAFCSKLYVDLFSPRWEIRHGSATALRELLKTHIGGGGKSIYMTTEEQEEAHNHWLEDAALRLLCVLALDRFGDFVSDQVVAPVRETCAQVMGTILKEMPNELVHKTVEILQEFVKQTDWEVRHGGILGIKYFVVVREDLIATFLPIIIKDVLNGLLDSVDDVSSVSASTLIPIAPHLPKLISHRQVSGIVKMLWDLLLDQDELAAACNSFMGLLAAILSLAGASHWIEMEPMENLIPRLWPFLSHPTSSVRRSTLQTLRKLTDETENSVMPPPATTADGQPSLRLNFGVRYWPSTLVQEALRHIYQRVLVEHVEDIQCLVEAVWENIVTKSDLATLLHASCPYVSCWMCLAMQPSRLAFDCNLMIYAKSNSSRLIGDSGAMPIQKLYLGGTETISQDVREKNVIRARHKACKMLGLLSQFLVLPAPNVVYKTTAESPMDCYSKLLLGYLSSRSSLQRIISSMIINFWAEKDPSITVPEQLTERLRASLTEYIYFDEIATMVTRLLQEASDFLASLKQYKVHLTQFDGTNMLTLDQIKELCTTATADMKLKYQLKTKVANLLEDRKKSLFTSYTQTSIEQMHLNISTQSALACAVARLKCLPEKLNPVVKPLMESIKREDNEILQKMAAECLTYLMSQTVSRQPSPNIKIITNLSTLLKSDDEFTPSITFPERELMHFKPNGENNNPYYGIITLQKQLRMREINSGNGAGSSRGPGRPPTLDVTVEDPNETDDPTRKINRTQRIGASFAVQSACEFFGESLPKAVSTLWELMFDVIMKIDAAYIQRLTLEKIPEDETNNIMISLQLLEIAAPHLHKDLHKLLFESLPKLCLLIQHPLKAVRHMASRCLATLSLIDSKRVMLLVINDLIPLLSQIESSINREGAIETITCIVNKLQFQIVPYVVLLIVPILGRMSDQNQAVRLIATNCFATLIQLMPLDGFTPDLGDDLKERKMKDKEFLDYLFRPKSIPAFKVPVVINAELRSYQQAGVNWLWFLNKYKLHGILCDDMGLGKTLQTICILAGDHHHRVLEKQATLPSLVICPPTLTGHWVYEVKKFISDQFLSPLQYFGLPIERERLRQQIKYHNLVVASYDIVRKDIEFFQTIHWNYCVLDEGHIIKNGKTKCSKAIKQLFANHRLILSGTPIQNNVLELWSLFDFLMPGFLGSEKQFQVRFSRPILASRDPKSSPKEQEAGALAMESLHRQVLPFLLRRVKEDVLTDLPPKITQDLLCELSPLQERLYEDFSKTHLDSNIRECLENMSATETVSKKTHVFQALRYFY